MLYFLCMANNERNAYLEYAREEFQLMWLCHQTSDPPRNKIFYFNFLFSLSFSTKTTKKQVKYLIAQKRMKNLDKQMDDFEIRTIWRDELEMKNGR